MNTNPTPTAYPLQWPPGWPATPAQSRQRSSFKTETPRALNNLKRELQLMGAKDVVLSSNYTLGVENPKEPGVCAYFQWCPEPNKFPQQFMPMAIPCDRWNRICDNIQAIALTVEAMRGMERWGARHMIKAMFSGFKQLPAGDTEAWWKVLGLPPDATLEQIRSNYTAMVKKHHPDHGGSHDEFVRIQHAYEVATEQRQ